MLRSLVGSEMCIRDSGRGVNVFSTDQSAISIEANAPEIEYRDGLLPRGPGFDGNLDNLIVTYPNNTDLAGTPLTSTFEIPVVNDITYNAEDAPDVLRLSRRGTHADDLSVTFGNAASRGTTNTFSALTGGELLPTVAAVREDDLGLQREIEAAVVNQKLEDHHGCLLYTSPSPRDS